MHNLCRVQLYHNSIIQKTLNEKSYLITQFTLLLPDSFHEFFLFGGIVVNFELVITRVFYHYNESFHPRMFPQPHRKYCNYIKCEFFPRLLVLENIRVSSHVLLINLTSILPQTFSNCSGEEVEEFCSLACEVFVISTYFA